MDFNLNCDSKTNTLIYNQAEEIVDKYKDLINSNQFDEMYEQLCVDDVCGMAISQFSIICEKAIEYFYSFMHNIPDYFLTCTDIKSFTVPDGYQIIGKEAFNCCKDLVAITIPKSVKKIKENAFAKCPNLKVIYYKGTQNDFTNINIEAGNEDFRKAEIYYV